MLFRMALAVFWGCVEVAKPSLKEKENGAGLEVKTPATAGNLIRFQIVCIFVFE